MRPLRLTLQNFHGIRSGMNRDAITLDVSGFRGLVALTGPNGNGKTTVLDNLHPYRLMPFRAGGYSPRQFSYYDETYGDARKTLEWEHGGETYKSDVVIKGTNKTKKTECYLFQRAGDEWIPASTKDGQPSDGKTDTYDACVNEILGAPEFFFTALFGCQERRRFSDYAPGEIKMLLSDLLGLDEPLALSEKAAESVKYLSARQDALRERVSEFDAATADHAAATIDDGIAKVRAATAETERKTANDLVMSSTGVLAEARARQATVDDVRRRRGNLRFEQDRIRAELTRDLTQLNQEKAAVANDGLLLSHMNAVRNAEAKIQTLLQRRLDVQRRIDALPAGDSLAPQIAAAEAELAQLDGDIAKAEADHDALRDAPATLANLQAKSASALTNGKSLRVQLDGLRQRAELIARVPCGELEIASTCPLLENARTARDGVPAVESEVQKARADYVALQAEIAAAEQKANEFQAARQHWQLTRQRRAPIEARLRELRQRQADAGGRATLEEQFSQLGVDLETEQKNLEQARVAVNDRRAWSIAQGQALAQRIDERMAQGTAAEQRVQAELDALGPEDAANGLAEAEAAHRAAQEQLTLAEREHHAAQAAAASALARLNAAADKIRATRKFHEEALALSDDIAQWKLLAKGLGRDGIVALSIDDAGPTIAALANDLLLACYGPRFSLKFETQAETKDGKLKETFNIVVFDAERGDEKAIGKTSGGERIYLNEALTRAICLFRVQSSGQQYHATFADESDGALDPERKRHFMKMKRRVLELGGFDAEFFISHEPELWELADHRIDLTQHRVNQ